MEQKNKITILSTFAQDTFIDEMNNFLCEQEGGPAFYLTKAFALEGIPFDLPTTSIGWVEILMTQDGERGKIVRKPVVRTIRFQDITSSFLVVSTLLDEIKLNDLSDFSGRIFLDVQGYVRDGSDFGKKRDWVPSEEIVNSIFCLKGTSEELRYIPDFFLSKQKEKVLVETMGESGCKIFMKGENITIRPVHIVSGTNTVGAGDIFFAYFIAYYIRNGDIGMSGKYAVEKTTEFLMRKMPDLCNRFRKPQTAVA